VYVKNEYIEGNFVGLQVILAQYFICHPSESQSVSIGSEDGGMN